MTDINTAPDQSVDHSFVEDHSFLEAIADPRPFWLRAIAVATTVIDAVDADQHGFPTPCGSFDVAELLSHVVFVGERVAKIGRGGQIELSDGPSITAGDWGGTWRRAASDSVQAWADDDRLAATIVLPWTTQSGAETLATYISELTTHTWDLATATGISVAWDDGVCEFAAKAFRREMPMADRTPMWEAFVAGKGEGFEFDPPFGNAVEVADDAPAIDRLVAWSGRTP